MAIVRSQNGWVARPDTKLLTRCTAKLTGGTLLHFWAANEDVGVVFTDFIEQFDQTVENVAGPILDDWSYANRMIRDSTSVVSNHGSATAIDLNALQHPRKVRNTYTRIQRTKLKVLVASYGGVLRHGEFYTGTIDGMHCEIDAGPVEVKRLADKIRARNAPKPTPPKEDTVTAPTPPTAAQIAEAVWVARPATVGQQTGGALHELDLRSASTEARLGPIEDDLAAVKAQAAANGGQLSTIAGQVAEILAKLNTPATPA